MLLKRIFSNIGILLGIIALLISNSKEISEKICDKRSDYKVAGLWWGQQSSPWGDLVGMSYLDKINKFREPQKYNFTKPTNEGNKNIDLYLYGDSYVFDIPEYVFADINKYQFAFRLGLNEMKLNSSKANILIIEMAERYIREIFKSTDLLDKLTVYGHKPPPANAQKTNSISINKNKIFNQNINQNLEYNLFNYNFLIAPRLHKAALNYLFFNRGSGDVVISENGNYLFYKPTVTDQGLLSCYAFIDQKEVHNIINNLNSIYDFYRSAGFDEIYISFIPNTAAILQPQSYNQLIPLIQNNESLKMKVIDIYTPFKHFDIPGTLFRAGDSHWNNRGLQIWIDSVNNILKNESTRQDKKKGLGDKI